MANIFDIAFSLTPRLGSRAIKGLIESFFSAENIFSQSYDTLIATGLLREDVARGLVGRVAFADAQKQLDHCSRYEIEAISMCDEYYPPSLREISDPPFVIYLQGNKEVLTRNIISIIGARKSSSYGERVTSTIVSDLGKSVYNLVIASGLAFGIDSIAHRNALMHDIPTIAFLPTALPEVTPAAHANLAKEIIKSGGCIVSEVAAVTSAAHCKPNYMQRNRLVVGSAAATVVVECGYGGGAYKAAINAIDEGVVVGAVPGRVGDAGAFGCNLLLASKVAFMVLGGESILRELNWDDRRLDPNDDENRKNVKGSVDVVSSIGKFTGEQLLLLRCFSEDEPFHISDLLRASNFPIGVVTAMLMELTVLGVVNPLPGSRYERIIPLSDIKE
ncbi:MAG: DNA-processing protein DprA [Rikenellaceae bacterium]